MKRCGTCIVIALTFMAMCAISSYAAYEYDSHGRRDPFVPLVGVPDRGSGEYTLDAVLTIDDISLQGIVMAPDGGKAVIINGEIVGEGYTAGCLTVVEIGKNTVKLNINGEEFTLQLYEQ